jgi:3-hydroxyacyl-[acyl-carrier-protein] dehydratase
MTVTDKTQMDAQIKRCLQKVTETEEGVWGRFEFPDNFIGFAGHFPDNPVLPGICKIKAGLILLEQFYQAPVEIQEIARAKFFAPVSVGQPLYFQCREISAEGHHRVVTINVTTQAEKKIAYLQLKFTLAN